MESIHFCEDVADRRGAEVLLIDKAPRSFVTWRAGGSATHFFLTYISPSTEGVVHTGILRRSDGSFVVAEGLDTTPYPSLGALIRGRRYLTAPEGSTTAVAGGGGEEPTAPSVLRRRAGVGVGGVAELPAHILPPVPDGSDEVDDDYLDDKVWMRGIKPTFEPKVFTGVLGICFVAAVSVLGATALSYSRHSASVSALAEQLGAASRGIVSASSATLFATLSSLDEDGTGVPLEAACVAAATAWRSDVAKGVAPLQTIYEASGADEYLGVLLRGLILCATLALMLQCTHTGRQRKRYVPTQADFLLQEAEDEQRRPFFQSRHSRWTVAYLSLVAATLVSGALLSEALWSLGAATTAVENAAHTLSLAYPADVRAQTNDGRTEAGSAATMYLSSVERGLWGAASVLAGVPTSCLAAGEPVIASLLVAPAVLRSTALPSWAETDIWGLLRLMGVRSSSPLSIPVDSLSPADPVAWSREARGWLDAADGHLRLVLPGHRAVTYTWLNVVALLLGGAMALIILQESLLTSWLPALRKWRAGPRKLTSRMPVNVDLHDKKE
jgi:hypothetical protein